MRKMHYGGKLLAVFMGKKDTIDTLLVKQTLAFEVHG